LTPGRPACSIARQEGLPMTRLSLACLVGAVLPLASCHTGGLEGESCTQHADCANGLVCTGLTCRTGVAGLTPTGKVCVTPECSASISCPGTETCTANKCTCTMDSQCAFGERCSGGACVRCVTDTDCFGGQVCVSGACTNSCMSDGDCPVFNSCQGNRCGFVGCKSDRECALAGGDVRSKCDMTTTLCYLPCATDVECGNTLTGGNWNNLICVQQRCEFVGCDTDADCIAAGDRNAQCVTKP
jgi:hypothetical protein